MVTIYIYVYIYIYVCVCMHIFIHRVLGVQFGGGAFVDCVDSPVVGVAGETRGFDIAGVQG